MQFASETVARAARPACRDRSSRQVSTDSRPLVSRLGFAAGIGVVKKLSPRMHLCECDSFIEFIADLAPRKPKDSAIEIDVLATRELRMKSRSDL